MALTNEQKKAIESFGSNVLVSAGAGSGKTHVLTSRVVHFIKRGIKLSEFLILTFTKLAASEMRERIRKRLTEEGMKEALDVDFANIQTFDSFAYSLVSRYHFRLNLSKDVTIVDSNIIRIKEQKIVQRIFDSKFIEKDQRFLNLIDEFCYRDEKVLVSFIVKVYDKIKSEIDFNEAINNILNKYNDDYIELLLKEVLNGLISDIEEIKNLYANIPHVYVSARKVYYDEEILDLISSIFPLKNYEDIINAPVEIKFNDAPRGYKDYVDPFKNKFNEFKEKCINLPKNKNEFFELVKKEEEYAKEIVSIIKMLHEEISSYKDFHQAFEYSDISKMAISLVKNNKDVLEELKYGYKVIMIDEYQDTSLIQDDFIKLIENDNVYMVGDVKQSIYRFRDARCDIFIDKYNNYKLDNSKVVIDMNKNFRSRKEVLNSINHIFSMIMTSDLGGANYKDTHKMEYGLTIYDKYYNPGYNYNLDFLSYKQIEGIKKEEIEARLIASDIINKINSGLKVFDNEVSSTDLIGLSEEEKDKLLFRKATYKDFAILIDRGVNFDYYRKVFEEYQIPLDIEKDEDVKSIDIVIFLKNLIKIIDCIIKGDNSSEEFKKSFLSICRSFVFEVKDDVTYKLYKSNDFSGSDELNIIKEAVKKYQQFDNYNLLLNVLYELDVYHKIIKIADVKNNSLYLDYFLDNFKVMSDLNYSLNDFYEYLCDLDNLDMKLTLEKTKNDLDSVKLMTIHKSKGLDFKLLYLAGAGVKFNQDNDKLKYSSKYGLILPRSDDSFNFLKDLYQIEEKKEANSEKLRLLYVALTRAREKITVLLEENKEYNIDSIDRLASFINQFKDYPEFKSYSLDILETNSKKTIAKNSKVLDIKELNIVNEKIEISRASHELYLDSNTFALELGTSLHFLLEIIDFKNPNYDIISDSNKRELVKSFIECPLLTSIKDGIIYKEYEFIDKEAKINGIIDLMIEYSDHIDIIDYKTSNIDDIGYINQVNIYCDYIKRITNKKTNGYLYSLVKKEYKKTN